jgi:glycosyltransferase involved in cell wall biosynthesis
LTELVSIGVPVFRGTKFVGEALQSIQAQTHSNLDVLISVDGSDHESAALCERLVRDDPRFNLVIQESQLGWAGNISFLMSQNNGTFWYFHQQDDIVSPDYVQSLLEHARKHPEAAVLYSDLEAFGTLELVMHQNSLLGTPAAREIGLLHDHLAAVAFRGLTRQAALDQAGGVRQNEIESFAAETTWMASVARAGDLVRLPRVLYFKRFHDENLHTKWLHWPLAKRKKAWQVHCRDMFLEAVRAEATTLERRLMWFAALTRLMSRLAAHYLPLAEFSAEDRGQMLEGFLEGFGSPSQQVEPVLELSWPEMTASSCSFFEHHPKLSS